MAATVQPGQGQGHLADNLEKQLNEIVRTHISWQSGAWPVLYCTVSGAFLTIILI